MHTNQFQYTIAVMNHLQQHLSDKLTNSVYCAEPHEHIMNLLQSYPHRIILKKPYTHIFTLKTVSLSELSVLVQSKGVRGTHVCAFTVIKQGEHNQWHKAMNQIMTVYTHTEIAQTHGAKVIQTEGRVDTAYKNVSQYTTLAEFWPQSKS